MKNENVIIKFSSCFDDALTLVEVLDAHSDFIVRVLGESDTVFPSKQEALQYAEKKAGEF